LKKKAEVEGAGKSTVLNELTSELTEEKSGGGGKLRRKSMRHSGLFFRGSFSLGARNSERNGSLIEEGIGGEENTADAAPKKPTYPSRLKACMENKGGG